MPLSAFSKPVSQQVIQFRLGFDSFGRKFALQAPGAVRVRNPFWREGTSGPLISGPLISGPLGISESAVDANRPPQWKPLQDLGPMKLGPLHQHLGVAFRVWAPHADAVSVVGSFNDWHPRVDPMAPEPISQGYDGCWYAYVENATIGDRYKYRIVHGQESFDRIDPQAREVSHAEQVSVIHDPHFDWQQDGEFESLPWNEWVLYQWDSGSLSREPFDELRRLGVNALQWTPIGPAAGGAAAEASRATPAVGFDAAHPFAIEHAHGGPCEFKRWVRDAHAAGFAVLMNVAYDHLGLPDQDLWRFDGWDPADKGGIYFYNDHRGATPWGDTRPNYECPQVRSFIRDSALAWLEEYRVDGLHFERTFLIRSIDGHSAQELPDGWQLTQWLNREIRAACPAAITIAEDLQNNDYLTKPDVEGGAGFSTQCDAGFVDLITEVLETSSDAARSMCQVREALYHGYNSDVFQRVIYTAPDPHAGEHAPSRQTGQSAAALVDWSIQKRRALALALTLTAPGIPMLFSGQQDWRGSGQRGGDRYVADLIRLRLNRDGTTGGLTGQIIDVFHVNEQEKIVAYRRSESGGRGDDVVVVINFANRSHHDYRIGFPESGRWRLRINSDASIYSSNFGNFCSSDAIAVPEACDHQVASGLIQLGPASAMVFSKNPSD